MNDLRERWLAEAQQRLIDLRGTDKGWAYRSPGLPAAEPTALAAMALLALNPESKTSLELATSGAEWLTSIQRSDGAVGLSAEMRSPEWPTPYALLLWSILGRYLNPAERAKSWLLGHQGIVFEKPPGSPLGHDTTIAGWSWVEQTHSWLEPTAITILALRRAMVEDHPRVKEGTSLILDRAIPDGGWNFGNNIVFGRGLRPKPAPTGMALLALSGIVESHQAIDRGLSYLEEELPRVRSAISLGWGLLGLTAWGRRPAAAHDWLADAWPRVSSRPDGAVGIASLILGSTIRSISLLGLPARAGGAHG
jgi:hypothetical protein